jgi:hypothetical protein
MGKIPRIGCAAPEKQKTNNRGNLPMRLGLIALTTAAVMLAGNAYAECTGAKDVEAAFLKQHQKGWHTHTTSKSDAGVEQVQEFDYLPPDRMYRKVTSGSESVETIGIGRWAWSNIGEGWNELQPQFAQMVTSHMQSTFATPKVSAEFTCLGTVNFDGKDWTAYQTTPEKTPDGLELARTILVDPTTGLPAFNIISTPGKLTEALQKEAFSYPDAISIDKPL